MRRIDLFAHNRLAYEKAERMLGTDGKAAIIHPTGTGKSYIAFSLIENHQDKRFVWLAPTEYIYNLQIEKLWQKQHVRFENIIFHTYNRLMWHEEIIDDLNPDYIILDEFHRAGAQEWGKSVRKLLSKYPNAKVLGLSATNIRYLDNRRDMADEIFEGSVASELTLCDAMAQKILPEPKYVVTVYSYEEKIRELEKRVRVMQSGYGKKKSKELIERLRRALEQADGMGEIFKKHIVDKNCKIILFCTDSDHMFEIAAKVPEWFYGIDAHPHIYRVYSYNQESEEDFQRFKDDDSNHLKLLFCIDMLNEGIHVDGVSAVVLCRPTVSPIIYKQQIGRAIAAGCVEKPVIFDLVNNFESLNPIDDFQNEYKEAKEKVRGTGPDYEDIGGFEIIDELKDCRGLMEQIQRNLDSTWDLCYKEFLRFVEENETTRVPRRYVTEEGLQLGKWLQRQRSKYREGKLVPLHVELLEKCGVNWESASDENFAHWVELLKEYKEKNGDLRIYGEYVTDKGEKLGRWCRDIRLWYSQGKVLPERQRLLEEMGFSWENLDYYWEEGYRHAKEYHTKHGNLNMQKKYICEDGYKLGEWINRQRFVREGMMRGIITDEKIKLLDELGMNWERLKKTIAKESVFEHFINAFCRYKKRHQDGLVPVKYIDEEGVRLGDWVSRIRRAYNQGTLKESEEKRLREVGFPLYHYDTTWHRAYLEAKAFYEGYGHLLVPVAYTEAYGSNLSQWVNRQRAEYMKKEHGKLSIEQVELLEQIHIEKSNCMVYKFEVGLAAFKSYIETYQDNMVPIDYATGDGFALGKWVARQRTKNNSGSMPDWQKRALDEAGMEWENSNTVKAVRYWNEMYEAAKQYAKEYGDISYVPHDYVTGDGKKLGQWISQQRGIRKGIRRHSIEMNEERIAMLDELGMEWNPPLYIHRSGLVPN